MAAVKRASSKKSSKPQKATNAKASHAKTAKPVAKRGAKPPSAEEMLAKLPGLAESMEGFVTRDQYVALLQTVARGYLTEGKRFMTVAIGCTGGKHRSVAMTEEIAARLAAAGIDTRPSHRDLGRE